MANLHLKSQVCKYKIIHMLLPEQWNRLIVFILMENNFVYHDTHFLYQYLCGKSPCSFDMSSSIDLFDSFDMIQNVTEILSYILHR